VAYVHTYWLRYRGTRFPVRRGEYILGRSPYCSIVVSNALASRQHCAVRMVAEGLSITDLNSRNGTFVNGERISEQRLLSAGDVIRVGSDSIEVMISRGEVERPAVAMPGPHQRHDTLDRLDVVPEPTSDFCVEIEDESNTITHNSTVDLIAELVEVIESAPDRAARVEVLRRSIDQLIEAQLRQPGGLDQHERGRLMTAIRTLATWFPDGRLGHWADDAVAALELRR